MEPRNLEAFHVRKSDSHIQKLKEEFGAEEKAEGRGVPVIIATPVYRRMSIVALIGHFRIQRELSGEHVVGAPAESPGECVAGGNAVAADCTTFAKAVHVDADAHIRIGDELAELDGTDLDRWEYRHSILMTEVNIGSLLTYAMAFPLQHHPGQEPPVETIHRLEVN